VPQFGILSDARCGLAYRWPAEEDGWQASTTVQELIRSLGSRPTRRATMVVHLAIYRPHPPADRVRPLDGQQARYRLAFVAMEIPGLPTVAIRMYETHPTTKRSTLLSTDSGEGTA
jgi:hypothetical protein